MDYSTRKLAKRGVYPLRRSFDYEYCLVCLAVPIDCIAKHQKSISPKDRSMDYSTQKLAKRVVYPLPGSFQMENRPDCPSGTTSSITKVLTDVHKIFQQN
ncbi:hypothetical protein H5410_056474 [Solanum commersonii]|uniref:Uncharacterized protein n=1 Tax=Solanum commersonii TaxID=4109 RepID=A0A9J5WMC8_SOLCO|nr:hypothetical protein H5410_056474 [Solanum commersonii]